MNVQIGSENVMLDLETLGTKPGCGILAIGACSFDGAHKFYEKILPDSNADLNLFIQQDTMAWHKRQPSDVFHENFSGTKPIEEVLYAFQEWFKRVHSAKVWGNGADFDLPILTYAYTNSSGKAPWKAFNGRCYRTLKNLFPEVIAGERSKDSLAHTALADALYQADHATRILERM